jgi:acetyl-CoA carboxylase biotin carboxyl carrier protein
VEPNDGASIEPVVKEAKELIRLLESTSVQRLVLAAGNIQIQIERQVGLGSVVAPAPAAATAAAAEPVRGGLVPDTRHKVLAPLVGIFYHAQSPGARPFVAAGERAQRGQVIGIIEAMKIMNEVLSDVAGVVVEVLVPNGQAVEYEQPLMIIDTAG